MSVELVGQELPPGIIKACDMKDGQIAVFVRDETINNPWNKHGGTVVQMIQDYGLQAIGRRCGHRWTSFVNALVRPLKPGEKIEIVEN